MPDRIEGFRMLGADEAEEFFFDLGPEDQADLLLALPPAERRLWLRMLAPDDAADVIQAADEEQRAPLLALLDEQTRKEVSALLAYAEDEAGGLMSSRYARVRPDMSVDEAISYLRRQALSSIEPETIYYVYVLDAQQRLSGVVSFRELFSAPGDRPIREVMNSNVVTVPDEMDQEAVARVFAESDLLALPVIDENGVLKGIVTVDDIVDVVEEEATEDIQKYGGMAALDEPYLRIDFKSLLKKRVVWLAVLFVGQMLTVSALSAFQDQMVVVTALGLFVPLIISSGGNSGSQASTLVIRAMAVGEVRIRDWWRVARRELAAGLALGAVLGTLGMVRVMLGPQTGLVYDRGLAISMLGAVVALSVVTVVCFGTLVGSMLPFVLRSTGLDPASASAPLVATLMDVSGITIYFTIAAILLAS
ncbi:MAG: magnesium transporter [Longimicrobiales bacterium]